MKFWFLIQTKLKTKSMNENSLRMKQKKRSNCPAKKRNNYLAFLIYSSCLITTTTTEYWLITNWTLIIEQPYLIRFNSINKKKKTDTKTIGAIRPSKQEVFPKTKAQRERGKFLTYIHTCLSKPQLNLYVYIIPYKLILIFPVKKKKH